jgi:hypothetical protein
MEPLPTITEREVSWHSVVAAIRARAAAEAHGCDPTAREAMIYGAAMPVADRPPIVLATLWAMEETDRHPGLLGTSCLWAEQALLATTLLQPERVLVSLLAGQLDDVRCAVVETAASCTPERHTGLERWFRSEMDRLSHLAGGLAEDDSLKK